MDAKQWPYTQPHIQFERYRLTLPGVPPVKGIAGQDAMDLVVEYGGTVERSIVVLITGGDDVGVEILGPWRLYRQAVAPPTTEEFA